MEKEDLHTAVTCGTIDRELLIITPLFLATVEQRSTVSEPITRLFNAGRGRQEDENTIISVFPPFSFSLFSNIQRSISYLHVDKSSGDDVLKDKYNCVSSA